MTHPLLLRCSSEKPIWYIYVVIRHKTWLYAPVRGYTTPCSPDASSFYQEKPRGVHDRGYTSHIVVMHGYILHVYRKGPRTT